MSTEPTMSPAAQRVAIARAVRDPVRDEHSWYDMDDRRYFQCAHCLESQTWGQYCKTNSHPVGPCSGSASNYPECLNAMREAEMTLSEENRDRCYSIIWKMARKACRAEAPHAARAAGWWHYTATAAQRAEAFLRTLNLYDPAK